MSSQSVPFLACRDVGMQQNWLPTSWTERLCAFVLQCLRARNREEDIRNRHTWLSKLLGSLRALALGMTTSDGGRVHTWGCVEKNTAAISAGVSACCTEQCMGSCNA